MENLFYTIEVQILWKYFINHVIFIVKGSKILSLFYIVVKIRKNVAVPIWGQWANTSRPRRSSHFAVGAGSTIHVGANALQWSVKNEYILCKEHKFLDSLFLHAK